MRTFHFHPVALEEYADATFYYARIRRELAEAFVLAVERGIEEILELPYAWKSVEEDIRRFQIRRFPYGIYYTIEHDGSILLVGVMHLSRKPRSWRSRLNQQETIQ